MRYETLIAGYKNVVNTIYSPKQYYERITGFLRNYKPALGGERFRLTYLAVLLKSIVVLGIMEKGRSYYWKLFFGTLMRRPRLFPTAIALSIYGFHFRKVFNVL